jgi:hypothetical protein
MGQQWVAGSGCRDKSVIMLISIIRSFVHAAIAYPRNDRIMADSRNQNRDCLLIMNGPGLSESLAEIMLEDQRDILVVNHFADSPEFARLQPKHYVFQDSYFWESRVLETFEKRRETTFAVIRTTVDWPMTVYLPGRCKRRKWLNKKLSNPNIKIVYFQSNFLKHSSGDFSSIIHATKWLFQCWRIGFLAPPPENVLVAALYLSAQLGYRRLRIVGADFTFFRELEVDQQTNQVIRRVKHFYGEEIRPVSKDKAGKLPSNMAYEMMKWSRAFRALEVMAQYLSWRQVQVINASSHSMIDCFPRGR